MKFKIGQKVKIVKKISSWDGASWVSDMDKTVNKNYEILDADEYIGYLLDTVNDGGRSYWYPEKALETYLEERIMGYSEAEKQEFRNKDLRISRLAILKSLIENCSEEDVNEVDKITDLTEKYVDYVYSERKETTKRGRVASVGDKTKHKPNWEQVAIGLNLAIPNSQNIKILNQVLDEYNKATKASANPKDILVHIMSTFGTYPTKTESVSKVVESLNLKG